MLRSIFFTLLFAGCFWVAKAQTYSFRTSENTSSTLLFGPVAGRHTQQIYWPGDIMDSTAARVLVNKLYFMRGANFGGGDSPLDSLYIRVTETRRRNYEEVFSPKYGGVAFRTQAMKLVAAKANFVASGGAINSWFGIDLDTPFEFNPANSLVLDVYFTGAGSNTNYSYNGLARFRNLAKPRIYMNNFVDTIGSLTSNTLPYVGLDIVTSTRPRNVLKAEVYPNPATSTISGGLPNPTEATATLIGTDGRRILLGTQSGWANWVLPNGLPRGVYTLLAMQGGLRYKAHLVVE